MNNAKVAVVILSWCGKKFLQQFVPGIIKSLPENAELIIADNASGDGTVEWLRENFKDVTIIDLKNNLGFAGGYNKALSDLRHEYFVLLNQDVEVSQGWLEPLIEMADEDKNIAAIQPKIKWQRNKNQFEYAGAAGGWIDKNGFTFCRGRLFDTIENDEGQFEDAQEIFWASGACMLVRRDVFIKAGMLDADLFAHMEEIDLCWRIHRHGYKVNYCPKSTVYHVGGGSLPQGNPFKTYLNFRNSLVLLTKNVEPQSLFVKLFVRMMLDNVAAVKSIFSLQWKTAQAIITAQLHFISHYSHWKSKRKTDIPFVPFEKLPGVYNKSLLWQYFIKRKRKFKELK